MCLESDDEKPSGGYTRDMFLKKAVDPEEEQAKARKKAEKQKARQKDINAKKVRWTS